MPFVLKMAAFNDYYQPLAHVIKSFEIKIPFSDIRNPNRGISPFFIG
jgi:hypothetical protein